MGGMESAGTRERLGEYGIVRELSAATSWLADDEAGRRVVLKTLPGDCLAQGKLRASIRERLERFQQAAHGGLANLIGVERDGDMAFLVWEFVDGLPLEDVLAARRRQEDFNALARELV